MVDLGQLWECRQRQVGHQLFSAFPARLARDLTEVAEAAKRGGQGTRLPRRWVMRVASP